MLELLQLWQYYNTDSANLYIDVVIFAMRSGGTIADCKLVYKFYNAFKQQI